MMGDWGHMMDWWGVPFMGFWIIGIIIAIVIIAYIIINSEKTEDNEIMSDAQKTLDNRYAKGEITRKEYLQAKEDLKNFNPK
jgi:uncharacterized membrane protein